MTDDELEKTARLFAAVPGYPAPRFSSGPAEVALPAGWGSHLLVAGRVDGRCVACREVAPQAALEAERCKCGARLRVVRVCYPFMKGQS